MEPHRGVRRVRARRDGKPSLPGRPVRQRRRAAPDRHRSGRCDDGAADVVGPTGRCRSERHQRARRDGVHRRHVHERRRASACTPGGDRCVGRKRAGVEPGCQQPGAGARGERGVALLRRAGRRQGRRRDDGFTAAVGSQHDGQHRRVGDRRHHRLRGGHRQRKRDCRRCRDGECDRMEPPSQRWRCGRGAGGGKRVHRRQLHRRRHASPRPTWRASRPTGRWASRAEARPRAWR